MSDEQNRTTDWVHDAEADALEAEIAALIDDLPCSKSKILEAWHKLQALGEHPSNER